MRSGRQPLGFMATAASVLAIIAIAACILTVTFQVLLTPVPTRAFATLYVDDETSPMDHDYLVETACKTLAYCTGDEDAGLPVGDDESVAYTPEVMSHLDDVTAFFSGMRLAAIVAVLVAMAAIFALWVACRERGRGAPARAGARVMIVSAVVVLVLLGALLAWAAIDFNGLFNMLHSFFFASGSWLFSYDSLLICALPEQFWMSMGVLWAVLILIVCVALIIAGIIVRRRYGRIGTY